MGGDKERAAVSRQEVYPAQQAPFLHMLLRAAAAAGRREQGSAVGHASWSPVTRKAPHPQHRWVASGAGERALHVTAAAGRMDHDLVSDQLLCTLVVSSLLRCPVLGLEPG